MLFMFYLEHIYIIVSFAFWNQSASDKFSVRDFLREREQKRKYSWQMNDVRDGKKGNLSECTFLSIWAVQ